MTLWTLLAPAMDHGMFHVGTPTRLLLAADGSAHLRFTDQTRIRVPALSEGAS